MTFSELKRLDRLDRLNRANNEVAAQDIYDNDFILVLGRSSCDRDIHLPSSIFVRIS